MSDLQTAVMITVNGDSRAVACGLNVTGLLDLLGLHPRMVVVEYNREILDRVRFDEVVVADGDVFELVHFVGGG